MPGVALITGASSGIGAETARRLDSEGWTLLLTARRTERLRALSASLRDASYVSADLTDDDAPARLRAAVEERHAARLDLLVNNAGAAWRAAFGDEELGGYANVRRTMDINFDAQVRLTEALLPLLRRSAPSAVVNVGSVAGRSTTARSGAYSASKFALLGWSEALHHEERTHGVHVGMVLPGWIRTEGFPHEDLMAKRLTRWAVVPPSRAAQAIVDAGPGGELEVVVPAWVPPWRAFVALRSLAPRLAVRVAGSLDRP